MHYRINCSDMDITKTLHVKSRREWRVWLSRHYKTEKEIWLIFYRKGSGKPRISHNDAVEEALCYGWIDSTVRGLDEEKFTQRFSARSKTSALSQMNRERIRSLIARGKMTRAGLDAVAHAFNPKRDRPSKFTIAPDILRALKANKDAWKNLKAFPESYKRIRIAYIESRRRRGRDVFLKSLNHFIKMTARNRRCGFAREMQQGF